MQLYLVRPKVIRHPAEWLEKEACLADMLRRGATQAHLVGVCGPRCHRGGRIHQTLVRPLCIERADQRGTGA